MTPGRLLTYAESSLLREALHERFLAFDYFDGGLYPCAQAEKLEVEERVATIVASWDTRSREEALTRNERFLTGLEPTAFPAARSTGGSALDRWLAFAELQWLVEDSKAAITLEQLGNPRAEQPLFRELPAVFELLTTKDRLFPLTSENVTEAGGSEQVFRYSDQALFPHPQLRPARELLSFLAQLAAEPRLELVKAG